MRDEAIADLSSTSEGELRQSEECGAMREHLAPSFFEKVQIGRSGGPEF